MCGIAGIIRPDQYQDNPAEIRRMVQSLAHRGPDGDGVLIQDGVSLGHRRLSIIDIDHGKQPLANEDRSVWVTFNGEIYNHQQLRKELVAMGHRFNTQCDTEVIVHAYEQWGDECVNRFHGMFAFAVVDYSRRRIMVVRDHLGIKPLYYRIGSGYFAFASELNALCQLDGSAPRGNPLAVELFLRFQYIPTPHTIYQNVFKLPPAHYMEIDFEGHVSQPTRYWDLQYNTLKGQSAEDWLDRVEAILEESIEAHLIADVPVGVLLSGGVDSTLIAHIASRSLGHQLKGFSIGFREDDHCELNYARQAAEKCGLDLHTHIVTEDTLDILPEVVAQYGEPFGDSSALATWYLAKLAREHVPVVLSGDGADEAFGGYQSYERWMSLASWQQAGAYFRVWPRMGVQWALNATRRKFLTGSRSRLTDWTDCITYTPADMRRLLWQPGFAQLIDQPCRVFQDAAARAVGLGRLDFAQYLDMQTYLPCDILTKVDIASMAHGLEVRPAILDRNVVQLAASMPAALRMPCAADGTRIAKHPLKAILSRHFSRDFVNRKKQGFAIPKTHWFGEGRKGQQLLDAMIEDPKSRLSLLIKPKAIRYLMKMHSPQNDHSGRLWLLLVLGQWLEHNAKVEFDQVQPALAMAA